MLVALSWVRSLSFCSCFAKTHCLCRECVSVREIEIELWWFLCCLMPSCELAFSLVIQSAAVRCCLLYQFDGVSLRLARSLLVCQVSPFSCLILLLCSDLSSLATVTIRCPWSFDKTEEVSFRGE